MSKSKKASAFAKNKNNRTGKITGTPIKGSMDKDLANLARMKKEAKEFEKTVNAKKKAQTSKLGLFGETKKQKPVSQVQKKDAKTLSKGGPKMGFTPKAFGIKGAPGPAGKKLKRMSSGGTVKTSSYYSSGGKVFTGR